MAGLEEQSTEQLFKKWRSGDPQAGNVMAQRFADWYYAIAVSRLGDAQGRDPMNRACERFGQGAGSVKDARKLVTWAHGIISEEIEGAGGRAAVGDHPNALTNRRKPSELLARARRSLPRGQMDLLAHAYDSEYPHDQVKTEAEKAGGYPLAVLEARYTLKRWLRDNEGVGFSEVPEQPKLDWAPVPLYEAARMDAGRMQDAFEQWMLSDLSLCKDMAEFAAFALAMRGGALNLAAAPEPEPEPTPPPQIPTPTPPKATPQAEASGGGGSKLPIIIGVAVVVVILVVALLMMR
ncbi:MAG: hypothetical protein H6741_03790 [Alphaproteobacteria bacterium]|nr:hypothetical protein [Alphaproteobacteria bacterium]